MQPTTKKWYQSRAMWIAIIQGLAGVFFVLSGLHPELGYIAIGKSVLDALLRIFTTVPIA